jgi:hypothetical protein
MFLGKNRENYLTDVERAGYNNENEQAAQSRDWSYITCCSGEHAQWVLTSLLHIWAK